MEKRWWAYINETVVGPFTEEELKRNLLITEDTYICLVDTEEWKIYGEVFPSAKNGKVNTLPAANKIGIKKLLYKFINTKILVPSLIVIICIAVLGYIKIFHKTSVVKNEKRSDVRVTKKMETSRYLKHRKNNAANFLLSSIAEVKIKVKVPENLKEIYTNKFDGKKAAYKYIYKNQPNILTEVSNGQFIIYPKTENNWYQWFGDNYYANNILAEVEAENLSKSRSGYGLFFCLNIKNKIWSYYEVGIDNITQSYSFTKYKNRKIYKIADWTKNNKIKRSGKNKIGIYRDENNNFSIIINNNIIKTFNDNDPLDVGRYGMFAYRPAKVAFDNFSLKGRAIDVDHYDPNGFGVSIDWNEYRDKEEKIGFNKRDSYPGKNFYIIISRSYFYTGRGNYMEVFVDDKKAKAIILYEEGYKTEERNIKRIYLGTLLEHGKHTLKVVSYNSKLKKTFQAEKDFITWNDNDFSKKIAKTKMIKYYFENDYADTEESWFYPMQHFLPYIFLLGDEAIPTIIEIYLKKDNATEEEKDEVAFVLRRLTKQNIGGDFSKWKTWWENNKNTFSIYNGKPVYIDDNCKEEMDFNYIH